MGSSENLVAQGAAKAEDSFLLPKSESLIWGLERKQPVQPTESALKGMSSVAVGNCCNCACC